MNQRYILILLILTVMCFTGCSDTSDEDPYVNKRYKMVEEQIEARGVRDTTVLEMMRKVPRHEFVPNISRPYAYNDNPLQIGYGQTISQPFIVAYMTEVLRLKPTDKVLEIGTGSGYQAAVLAEIVDEVYTIEIVEALAEESRNRLKKLGYNNIYVKIGDGYEGWEEHAPFDAIIVTAAPENVPQKLVEQLKVNGRMIIPVGVSYQELRLITKQQENYSEDKLLPVRFVPMIQ